MSVQKQTMAIFHGTVDGATRSIVEGSELTGSPGQPVDTGALKASWQTIYETPTVALIATNIEYAPYVEEGINSQGPVNYRVGGPHNVKLTVAGIDRIVADEVVRTTEGRAP